MSIQILVILKGQSTIFTFNNLGNVDSLLMVLEGSLGVEEATATSKSSLTVNVHVGLQCIRSIEGFSTSITLKSLLLAVNPHMTLVETQVSEGLRANFTFEFFHGYQN